VFANVYQKHVQNLQEYYLVGLDCEMVQGRGKKLLARVSLVQFVNSNQTTLIDEYVFVAPSKVQNYLTSVSGITKEILLEKGKPFGVVKEKVINVLQREGVVIVGHSLTHDFRALSLTPRASVNFIDTSFIFSYIGFPRRTCALKDLAQIYLKMKIQTGSHSSLVDATIPLQLIDFIIDKPDSVRNPRLPTWLHREWTLHVHSEKMIIYENPDKRIKDFWTRMLKDWIDGCACSLGPRIANNIRVLGVFVLPPSSFDVYVSGKASVEDCRMLVERLQIEPLQKSAPPPQITLMKYKHRKKKHFDVKDSTNHGSEKVECENLPVKPR